MLIGEVKEGRTELNEGARNRETLRFVLARFGCCSLEDAPKFAEDLIARGIARLPSAHQARLVAFGSLPPESPPKNYRTISLGPAAGATSTTSGRPTVRRAEGLEFALDCLPKDLTSSIQPAVGAALTFLAHEDGLGTLFTGRPPGAYLSTRAFSRVTKNRDQPEIAGIAGTPTAADSAGRSSQEDGQPFSVKTIKPGRSVGATRCRRRTRS
jgi:hypothetical protein